MRAGPLRRRARPAARDYAAARLPAGGVPWREASFAGLDPETTGLDPRRHEIIACCVVRVDGRAD